LFVFHTQLPISDNKYTVSGETPQRIDTKSVADWQQYEYKNGKRSRELEPNSIQFMGSST
jgi:hypothetical protein